MEKEKILKIITFIIVFLLSFICIAIIIYIIYFHPFMMGDATANVTVWEDVDGDGKRSEKEPYLNIVCVWAGYGSSGNENWGSHYFSNWNNNCANDYHKTKSGKWADFFPGGSCDEIFISVLPPQGYKPTTPLVVNDCSAEFGFITNIKNEKVELIDLGNYLDKVNEQKQIGINIKYLLLFLGMIIISSIASVIAVRSRK